MIYFDQFKNSISEIINSEYKQEKFTIKKNKINLRKYNFSKKSALFSFSHFPFWVFLAIFCYFFNNDIFTNFFIVVFLIFCFKFFL